MRRLLRVLRGEAGYSIVELLTVMVILGIVLGGITTIFVQGSNAELHMNNRFQAQIQATAAFDRLRRDVHCASSASITSGTMTLTGCSAGQVSWCTVASGSTWSLYRLAGATCDATGKLYAESLAAADVFSYTAAISGSSLAKVTADIAVNVSAANALDRFELSDDIVLRNSSRS
jgi:prepilin-type N-terminal cleavage/methylation domain-containing protein